MDTEHSAITEPVRRIEVFTGAGRRRTWSAEDKARIVAESTERAANRSVPWRDGTAYRRSNCSLGAGKRGSCWRRYREGDAEVRTGSRRSD